MSHRTRLEQAQRAYSSARRARRIAENRGASTRALIDAHRDAGVAVADALELVELVDSLAAELVDLPEIGTPSRDLPEIREVDP